MGFYSNRDSLILLRGADESARLEIGEAHEKPMRQVEESFGAKDDTTIIRLASGMDLIPVSNIDLEPKEIADVSNQSIKE